MPQAGLERSTYPPAAHLSPGPGSPQPAGPGLRPVPITLSPMTSTRPAKTNRRHPGRRQHKDGQPGVRPSKMPAREIRAGGPGQSAAPARHRTAMRHGHKPDDITRTRNGRHWARPQPGNATDQPDLGATAAQAPRIRRLADRRQCARCSRRGLITKGGRERPGSGLPSIGGTPNNQFWRGRRGSAVLRTSIQSGGSGSSSEASSDHRAWSERMRRPAPDRRLGVGEQRKRAARC